MAERPAAPVPWPDARLDAAFATLAPAVAPPHLASVVVRRLDDDRERRWHLPRPGAGRFALAALVGVLAVALAVGSWAAPRGAITGSMFTVQPGPDGLSVFDAGTFRFTFPSAWSAIDTGTAFSGGSVLAVLTTLPPEARCGAGHLDINCIYEQALDAGTIRVVVGSTAFRGATIFDRADVEAVSGTTTRATIAGMPAILDEMTIAGSFYREDLNLRWQIGMPGQVSNAVSIEVLARDPGAADARAATAALVASFAFTPPPAAFETLPAESGPHLARLAIARLDQSFREGFGQTTGENHYSCQPDEPGAERATAIRFSAGGDLGGEAPVTCSWAVTAEGTAFWRVELHVDWTADGRSGRYTELDWIDGAGQLAGSSWSGEGPPAVPPPSPTPAPVESILGLPVMTVEQALTFMSTDTTGLEIAVRGWFGAPAIRHGCVPPDPSASPLQPRCGEELVRLMRDPELLTGSKISPVGPSLNPLVRGSLDAEAPMPVPQDVIILGHVRDARASACAKADRAACAAAFVADRVVAATPWTAALASPTPWLDGLDTLPRDAAEVWEYLRFAVDESRLLSIGVVDGARLATLEPAITDLHDPGPVWVATVLGRRNDKTLTEPRTIVVPDSWIFPGTDAGHVIEIVNGHAEGFLWIID